MNETISIVTVIQAMLAPGLMISACGLLLLGMNNKYSLVVNRIRLMNEEKRRYFAKASQKEFEYEEEVRLASIGKQLERLSYRVKLVRNAVLFYSTAVALFVMTSFLIGLEFATKMRGFEYPIIGLFTLGMLQVLVGIVFAGLESIEGYKIVSFEIQAND